MNRRLDARLRALESVIGPAGEYDPAVLFVWMQRERWEGCDTYLIDGVEVFYEEWETRLERRSPNAQLLTIEYVESWRAAFEHCA